MWVSRSSEVWLWFCNSYAGLHVQWAEYATLKALHISSQACTAGTPAALKLGYGNLHCLSKSTTTRAAAYDVLKSEPKASPTPNF